MTEPHPPSPGPDQLGEDGNDASEEDAGSGTLLRGRALAAAAAIAVGLIAAVLIVSTNNDDTADRATGDDPVDIAADGTVAPASTSPEPGTSAQVSTEGPFDIALDPASDGLLRLTVADAETPALDGTVSQHCVLVTMSGPTTVEAFGCVEAGDADPGQLQLSSPGDPQVGCAAVTAGEPSGALRATAATSTFVIDGAGPLPAGTYDVSVVAVTGVGDGCLPVEGPAERSATATSSLEVG